MRVGVDVDDVIYPWLARAHAACRTAGITNGNLVSHWEMWEDYGCTKEQWVEVLEQATRTGFLHDAAPIPGATSALDRLREAGHTIHLVTARGFWSAEQGSLIRAHTVEWLNEWQVPHDSLTFSLDKSVVRTDMFADDSPRNVAALLQAGIHAHLIDAPHNQDVEDGPMHRNASLAAFVDEILEAAA